MPSKKTPATYSEVMNAAFDRIMPKVVEQISSSNLFYKAMQNKPNKWGLQPSYCDKCEHSIHFSFCGVDGCKCISTVSPKPAVALKQAIDQAESQKQGKQKYRVHEKSGYQIQTIHLPYPPATSIKVVHGMNKAAVNYFRFMDDGGQYFYAEEGTPVTTLKKIAGSKNQAYAEAFASEKLKMSAAMQELDELKQLAAKAHADKVAKKLYELEKKLEEQDAKQKLEQQMQSMQSFKFVPSPDGVWNTTQPYVNPYAQQQKAYNESYKQWKDQQIVQPYPYGDPYDYAIPQEKPPYPGLSNTVTQEEPQPQHKPKPEPEPEIVGEKKRRMIAINVERIGDEQFGTTANQGQPVGDPPQETAAGGEGREGESGEAPAAIPQADGA